MKKIINVKKSYVSRKLVSKVAILFFLSIVGITAFFLFNGKEVKETLPIQTNPSGQDETKTPKIEKAKESEKIDLDLLDNKTNLKIIEKKNSKIIENLLLDIISEHLLLDPTQDDYYHYGVFCTTSVKFNLKEKMLELKHLILEGYPSSSYFNSIILS